MEDVITNLSHQKITEEDTWLTMPGMIKMMTDAESEKSLPPQYAEPIDLDLLVGTLEATKDMYVELSANARLRPGHEIVPAEVGLPRVFSSEKVEDLNPSMSDHFR